jgi:hypothetical protein
LVEQLNGVRFQWKENDKKGIGIIAQELEQVLPELVTVSEDGQRSVNYDGIIGVLIQAIKELQDK